MAESANFYMYTASMPPMRKARVEAQLRKRIRMSDGSIVSAADYIAHEMRDGYMPAIVQVYTTNGALKDEHRLQKNTPTGTTSVSPFNKTMYGFAQYLVDCGAVEEAGQAALRTQEDAQIAAIERAKQEKLERSLAETQRAADDRKAFKEWLAAQSLHYASDPRVAIIIDVMLGMYGPDYPAARCAQLLALIDNLHNERARNYLLEYLHPMNKGSRKAFQAITGKKLPSGVKATGAYILSLGGTCDEGSKAEAG